MFLGFDETCAHIENVWDRVIPVVKLLLIPYIIVLWLLSVIISLSAWFIGYWRCVGCQRVYSCFTKKHKVYWCYGWDDAGYHKYCPKCECKSGMDEEEDNSDSHS